MKITEINNSCIVIDDKYTLEDFHDADCCERVYADFENLQYFPSVPIGIDKVDARTVELKGDPKFPDFIEIIEGLGFKIQCEQGYILVSCYDIQNGYYSNDLTLLCTDTHSSKTVYWEKDISLSTKHEYV